MQFDQTSPKPLPARVSPLTSLKDGIVATAIDTQYVTDHIDGVTLFQVVYLRDGGIESDIKRAVAFFSISFSISRRLMRSSRSWIFCCSGVNALP